MDDELLDNVSLGVRPSYCVQSLLAMRKCEMCSRQVSPRRITPLAIDLNTLNIAATSLAFAEVPDSTEYAGYHLFKRQFLEALFCAKIEHDKFVWKMAQAEAFNFRKYLEEQNKRNFLTETKIKLILNIEKTLDKYVKEAHFAERLTSHQHQLLLNLIKAKEY